MPGANLQRWPEPRHPRSPRCIRAKIAYTLRPYEHDPRTTAFGDEVVAALGQDPARVFKTLVAAVDGQLVVAVVPVAAHLDLKALAAAAGGKEGSDGARRGGGTVERLRRRRHLPGRAAHVG